MSIIYYSDIDLNLDLNTKGELKVNVNEQCINDQIKYLLTTFRGEVLFEPYKGNHLDEQAFLFDHEQADLNALIVQEIKRVINFIDINIEIKKDEANPRLIKYDVTYTIKNDPNIGKVYSFEGVI